MLLATKPSLLLTVKVFFDCKKQMSQFVNKGVTYDGEGNRVRCLFCRIQTGEEPGKIVYEDEKFVVFHTIKPITHLHLLVTPREHIANAKSLSGNKGADLIEELVEIGKKALGPQYADEAQYCFHIPPWNSIDHLHLHAIADAHTMSCVNRMKYPNGEYGHCRSAKGLINELRASKKQSQ